MQFSGARYILYTSRSDILRGRVFCDGHDGARGARNDMLERDIEEVRKDPRMFWLHLGDWADLINVNDRRRFDPTHVAEDIPVSAYGNLGTFLANRTIARFAPIAEKSCGVGFGNHEWYHMRYSDQMDLQGYVCTMLGVPNLGYGFFLDLIFLRVPENTPGVGVVHCERPDIPPCPSWRVRFFGHHGCGQAQTPGGKIKKVGDVMERFSANIYVIAHGHTQIVHPALVQLGANDACDSPITTVRLGAMAGSYLGSYPTGQHPSYAERAMYRAASLGAMDIYFEPDKRRAWIATTAKFDKPFNVEMEHDRHNPAA